MFDLNTEKWMKLRCAPNDPGAPGHTLPPEHCLCDRRIDRAIGREAAGIGDESVCVLDAEVLAGEG